MTFKVVDSGSRLENTVSTSSIFTISSSLRMRKGTLFAPMCLYHVNRSSSSNMCGVGRDGDEVGASDGNNEGI